MLCGPGRSARAGPRPTPRSRAVIGDLSTVAPQRRMATLIEGVFGAAAFAPAPRRWCRSSEEWRPDLVIHPITELAARGRRAVRRPPRRARARPAAVGGMDVVRRPLPRSVHHWDVPDLATTIVEAPYVDDCPPSLQPDAVAVGSQPGADAAPTARRAHRPASSLPWSDDDLDALPYDRTVHLTLGTMFHGAIDVFETALDGLHPSSPVNVLVTSGPTPTPPASGRNRPRSSSPTSSPTSCCCRTVTRSSPRAAPARSSPRCAGLPHLILPQGADQFVNGATAEAAGVALTIPPAELTADVVTDTVRRLLEETSFGAAAQRVQDEIAGLPTPDDLLAALTPPTPWRPDQSPYRMSKCPSVTISAKARPRARASVGPGGLGARARRCSEVCCWRASSGGWR